MKKIAILLAAVAVALSAAAAHTTRIAVEKGERWWGIFAAAGPMQPFSAPFRVNTADAAGQLPLVSMMFSSLGRYVWSDHPMTVDFDGRGFTIVSDFEPVEVQKGGRNLREAYLVCRHKHCPPDAAAPAPDPMLFEAPYYETAISYGRDHSAADLLAYARRLLAEGFPAGVMVVAEGWQQSNGSFEFDPRYYPDPKAFTDQMHALGFRVMLSVTPFTVASGREYFDMGLNSRLVAGPDGSPAVWLTETGHQACLDLRREAVTEYVSGKLAELVKNYGIDGLRMDAAGTAQVFGEGIAAAMTNWNAAGAAAPLCQYAGLAGMPCATSPLCLQQGASRSLAGALNDLVTAGLAGHAFCMPLWSAAAPAEDALRCGALQLAALQPVASVPFTPWLIADEQFYPRARQALKRRMEMTAYIRELAAESVRTAEPVVRCMEYNYPRSGFADCTDQYMIGTRYIIVPVSTSAATHTVRLPKGAWLDANGKRYRGPVVIEAKTASGPAWFESVK